MIDAIKKIRDETGAPLGDIRAALAESGGDTERAVERLRERYGAIAEKKAAREVKAGVVESYIHSNGRIGVLVELHCETDFVGKNREFRDLAHDIAMQIAATAPADLEALEIQPFIKDPTSTIGDLIRKGVGKFGENIKIGNFARFAL